jgi:ATP-dependent Clp protease ATP-binding subunit ClpA
MRLLRALGVSRDDVLADLARVRRRGGVSDEDAAALNELGIDVDQIVARVEESHGPGALAETRTRTKRTHLPFTREAKQVLEGTLREAQELGDKHLGQEHLLLALARQRGPVAEFLAARGIDYPAVRQAVGKA